MNSQYEQGGVEQDFQHGFQKDFQKDFQQDFQQGFQQGLLEGRRQMRIDFLRTRFGALPESLVLRVNALVDPVDLTAALGRAASAQTLDETGI